METDRALEADTRFDAADLKLLAFMAALEETLPGFSDLCVRHAEDDNLHLEVRRLGTVAPDPAQVAEARKAIADVRAMRFITLAHVPRKRGKARA